MSPFQVVYDCALPYILYYVYGTAKIGAVDSLMEDRTQALTSLRVSLARAQLRMKNMTDRHRKDSQYQQGDWVFVRLQLYRQSSVVSRPYQKLAKRYFGPFQIAEHIGPMAYKLELPQHTRIHNVFHVSLPKCCVGDPTATAVALPKDHIGANPIVHPSKLIGFCSILRQGKLTPQFLVK
ncbi:unnamed protein product [Rhodiola kirilowii]